nr:uncharacterized protein LOC127341677 [Lolium perenne]
MEVGSTMLNPIVLSDGEEEMQMDMSDSDMDVPVQQPVVVHRGPRITGNEEFDKHCVWGNNLVLNEDQCKALTKMVRQFPGKPIKYYVYMMSKSSVIQKNCKLVCTNFNSLHNF